MPLGWGKERKISGHTGVVVVAWVRGSARAAFVNNNMLTGACFEQSAVWYNLT